MVVVADKVPIPVGFQLPGLAGAWQGGEGPICLIRDFCEALIELVALSVAMEPQGYRMGMAGTDGPLHPRAQQPLLWLFSVNALSQELSQEEPLL